MQQLPSRHSPWHAGERQLQEKVGVAERMEALGQKMIRDHMPEQHREFFQRLPFMIAGAVDRAGQPWATLIEGEEGFVTSPDPRQLSFDLAAMALDPLDQAIAGLGAGDAVGLLGIELHTRRRNRINGQIRQASAQRLEIAVEHSFGNCPQYIQLRHYRRVQARGGERLDASELDVRSAKMIRRADTFFVASYVEHDDGRRAVDVSHRGGRAGFVRVEGNRLTIPDYAGNLAFNTLGNLSVNPRAGLLFIDFATGDVLQLGGRAEVILDSPLIEAFAGAERLRTFDVEQVVLRSAAVALRWDFEAYAPTSLMTGTWTQADARLREPEPHNAWQRWRVQSLQQESADIRSFVLAPETGAAPSFAAGQHLPIRISGAAGEPLLRSYSLSSAPSDGYLRISVKAQGVASRYLHAQVRVGDVLEVRAPLGRFTLNCDSDRPLVLIGAGVGITPLLSMLREQVALGQGKRMHFFQGARTLADLPFQAELRELVQRAGGLLKIHRALSAPEADALLRLDYEHHGRIELAQIKAALPFDDYDFYLCGPAAFTQAIYDGLRALNIADERIHAEAFGPSTLTRRRDSQSAVLTQPPAANEAVAVHFSASSKEASWKPGSGSLLHLAESCGLTPEFSCRGGTCGTCRTRLVSGQVHYPQPPLELPDAGDVLICCAVPARSADGLQPLVLDL
ncbi:pyridoxamine 5'-phosphate oxidase family protein [Pseudomonas wenzhouensis]|uniref:pyridoxamine 5'-phosphate oxidase family protein n=1 Tax=Pseudomonas wenzhouensis TaxID=2906062 RepID=UPI001E5A39D3|nr:pyridoxamine 5'-phosphate oxidase family protein [Pseudomonas wenzhouensis]UFQ98864.1 pyridoxamine 5'-phosphate oxidase family protein [Pseudomonas wenzhouensis]